MSESFSNQLRQKLEPVWRAIQQHDFLVALGDGTLNPVHFQTWVRQNYLFLIGYARLFSHAAARTDRVTMRWMISMAHAVLHQDMLLHEAYSIEFGLGRDELANGVKLHTTRAYTDHLLRIASLGSMVELVAALLPYLWIHQETSQELIRHGKMDDNRYARWIEHHSGPVAEKKSREAQELLNLLAERVGPDERATAEDAFATSSRYEWQFLETCFKGENLPV